MREGEGDQIGRFFALWATIQSRWQQLFYPNRPNCLAIFGKGVKIILFSSEIIFGQVLKTFGDFYLVRLNVSSIATVTRNSFFETSWRVDSKPNNIWYKL